MMKKVIPFVEPPRKTTIEHHIKTTSIRRLTSNFFLPSSHSTGHLNTSKYSTHIFKTSQNLAIPPANEKECLIHLSELEKRLKICRELEPSMGPKRAVLTVVLDILSLIKAENTIYGRLDRLCEALDYFSKDILCRTNIDPVIKDTYNSLTKITRVLSQPVTKAESKLRRNAKKILTLPSHRVKVLKETIRLSEKLKNKIGLSKPVAFTFGELLESCQDICEHIDNPESLNIAYGLFCQKYTQLEKDRVLDPIINQIKETVDRLHGHIQNELKKDCTPSDVRQALTLLKRQSPKSPRLREKEMKKVVTQLQSGNTISLQLHPSDCFKLLKVFIDTVLPRRHPEGILVLKTQALGTILQEATKKNGQATAYQHLINAFPAHSGQLIKLFVDLAIQLIKEAPQDATEIHKTLYFTLTGSSPTFKKSNQEYEKNKLGFKCLFGSGSTANMYFLSPRISSSKTVKKSIKKKKKGIPRKLNSRRITIRPLKTQVPNTSFPRKERANTNFTLVGTPRPSNSNRTNPIQWPKVSYSIKQVATPILSLIEDLMSNPIKLKKEGLFRVPANGTQVKYIIKCLLENQEIDLKKLDAITIAGCIKYLLSHLEPKLISADFLEVKQTQLSSWLHTYEPCQDTQKTLKSVVQLCLKIAENSKDNLMNFYNLGIAFAPSLIESSPNSKNTVLDVSRKSQQFQLLLETVQEK